MPSPGRYPYGKLAKYARLRPEDVTVWERFMRLNPNKEWTMDYDVKVGLGRKPLEELPPELQKDWRDLTRKRIDAVAWSENNVFLIEIKPRAGLSAIGQIIGYSELWIDLHDNDRRVRPVVICHSTDPDTIQVAKAAGIEIVILKDASSS